MKKMKKYIKLMRIHHYIKNFLILVPLICSGQILDWEKLSKGTIAFISFCACSSIIYIINDIQDVEKDRKHPVKKNRPIASGKVKISQAYALIGVLIIVMLIFNALVFRVNSSLFLIVYVILNLGYSKGWKNIPLLDICILVSGFVIRILYGGIVTDIQISNWLYLTVFSISFYFALGKRRNELKQNKGAETRTVLKYYSEAFLDKNMYMFLCLANVFYSLWSMDEKIVDSHGGKDLIFTVPIVLVITMKYSLNIEGDSDGDPVEVLLHDKALILLCFVYTVVMLVILYC